MNDRHPSGTATTPAPASDAASAPYASYGHQEASYGEFTTYGGYNATDYDTGHHATATTPGAFEAGTFETGTFDTAAYGTDPLFGTMPGSGATGSYDASQWSTGSHQTLSHDPYAVPHQTGYDTGSYDSTGWTTGYEHLGEIPAQTPGPEATGQWNTQGWLQADQLGQAGELGQPGQTQQWAGAHLFDTGAYDATQWNSDGTHASGPYEHPSAETLPPDHSSPDTVDQQATATFEPVGPYGHGQPDAPEGDFDGADGFDTPADGFPVPPEDEADIEPASVADSGRAATRAAGRSRRRGPARRSAPAKRSALLTVAVPSACVMGVAGIAAASVGVGGDDGKETTATASDATAVKPSTVNNKLDTQLESLSAGADDFADRASRTQERIDLKAQQEAEQKRAAEEAARKERLRPKFALPVSQHGLSAYYGQSGINWMSLHTGIDFPVSYGTPVMAATDGTVRTQWNSAYGNMVIVTAKDGTETWYCHLSTYKVASGTAVKAGDAIAYSGNSGNSTGPHLHFEVRPGGGSAIDPLAWFRSHGLDPS
ncbi:M23 family metallopeptidase [Streptomyces poonensis]|uniref:Peptidase n=1 Tax=Streptomyces poonensis TaxID=68255 RepID=A0A918P9S5_9ACTN|nr:M23 family metallopeptidase [Streptomyces poonensis]GGY92430.1 peptidase [Streptomyces poonensis]GLJ87692.1 peptidase [Streptomyces poonensis]